ncbi:MAG: hypothetical protein V4732_12865 [Pseudomonadota bacterium]
MSNCWICNKNEAVTGEHIFKHSILRDMYGRSRLEKGDRLIIWEDKNHNGKIISSKKYIDSTDSGSLKFKKSLCHYCNGAKSQKWDDQFDIFLRYLLENYKTLLVDGYIDLGQSMPNFSKTDTRNLYNYFCKLFGCLLFTNGQSVPTGIVDAVNGSNYTNALGLNIVFDVRLQSVSEPRDYLVNHELVGDTANELNYRWALGFDPIKIGFWFRTPAELVVGEQWFGKSKIVPFVKNI